MVSCWKSASVMSSSNTQSWVYSMMISRLRLWSISLIHILSASAWAIDLFFLLLCLYSSGNRVARASPLSHLEFQKDAFLPFPSWTTVAALKRALSSSVIGICRPSQGLALVSQLNHSHLSLSDWLKRSRSLMPRPPFGCGAQTHVHATLHLPQWVPHLQPKGIFSSAYQFLSRIALTPWSLSVDKPAASWAQI